MSCFALELAAEPSVVLLQFGHLVFVAVEKLVELGLRSFSAEPASLKLPQLLLLHFEFLPLTDKFAAS